ncbi:MAG: hypothetical protein GYB64_17840 [Chloroflexi bacterium]|nr:hypothetical protein [Chloroflexota bacterium]
MSDEQVAYDDTGEDKEHVDLGAEFAALGRKFADAMRNAWDSEERQRIENEFREGFRRFSEELEKGFDSVRQNEQVRRVEENMRKVRDEVDSSEAAQRIRQATINSLRGLSDTLERMAQEINKREESAE